ncbi:TPA: hypothetical protein DEW05_03560 [Candidatus Saccharibacteria bacterium]|nr:hypothetical protein [Candidatus Saccharibacteria bacterium]
MGITLMVIINNINNQLAKLRRIPLWYYLGAIGCLLVVWYVLSFVVKHPVEFSYANATCTNRLTVLPQLHKSSTKAPFDIKLDQGIDWLYATRACVEPTKQPEPGTQYVSVAPLGGLLFRQQFAIDVPKAPAVDTKIFDKPLSVTQAATIPLDDQDDTHEYRLEVATKNVICTPKKKTLACDVSSLELAQGKKYPLTLIRAFKDTKKTLVKKTITTLPAVTLKQSSIQPGEVVYAKPKEFTMTMDKSLVRVKAELVAQGDTKKKLPIEMTVDEDAGTIRVRTDEELERNRAFELRLTSAEAQDGSGLDGVVNIPFRTSGGPEPSDVSARGNDVDPGSTAVITFDQEISQEQDIAKYVKVTGAEAQISRTANQLNIALVNAPKCADITIAIEKGFTSKYDIPREKSWQHSFRTKCYTLSTIGYSTNGRPITAYHFGNGGEAILFVGGIHGSEQSSSLILHDLIDDLNVNAKDIPASRQIVVVPTLNPDGYAAGARNNANNVNLNRNFATNDWQTDLLDTNGEVKGGGGPEPMSEPETRAIAALSSQLQPRFVLSYHAVGSVVIGNLAGDANSQAASYAATVGYSNGTGRDAEIFDYAISGTYDDWLAQKLGVGSMIVELGSYTYRNYSHHKPAMWRVITN